MNIQNQIRQTLAEPAAIHIVCELLDKCKGIGRTELARQLCRHFGFFDALGKEQLSGCLKAIRSLAEKGHFVLPEARNHPGNKQPRRLGEPLAVPNKLPAYVSEISELRVELVTSEQQMRTWNEMMITDHPRGAGPLVGRQLRYLVVSEYGYLGGLGFGAAALYLSDREQWIGWDKTTHNNHLHRVVGLSRFLIRDCVSCQNLASRVLAMGMQQLRGDFEAQYGFSPWLVETFVDIDKFPGTCFRAANWTRIGQTCGRGRQDRNKACPEAVKDIYVYTLEEDLRSKMGLPPGSGLGPIDITESVDADGWADREFGGAPIGDARLRKRLVKNAAMQAEKPGQSFNSVAEGDWASIKGYYRLIDHPDESAVTMANILLPHRHQTIRRMAAQRTVLCIQDGTDLNYSSLAECKGLGTIGKNQTGAASRGLHLHTTFAVTTNGLPLGVLTAQCWAPESRSKEAPPIRSVAIEDKASHAWIKGLEDCREVAFQQPHTKIICVMDREADIFELFHEHRQNPTVDLLVRAQYNRRTTDDSKLFDTVKNTPVVSQLRINVKRQSARPKLSKKKARPKRDARTANVCLRYAQVELRPPSYHRDKAPIPIWGVHVLEENPPGDAEAIEWFLLTTVKITSAKVAENCLRWYCLRWRIEDWHRVLKSGCRIDEAAHRTGERLKRAIAINLVIAWRIMLMTLLGREAPKLPAEVLFSDIEIEVLTAYADVKKNI